MTKIAFIGIGHVGSAIANQLQIQGFHVMIGARNAHSESVKKAKDKNENLEVMSVSEAVEKADIVFLAVPFDAAVDACKDIDFKGKILVDCTNPVGHDLTHGLKSQSSGSELVQENARNAKVVKAFTTLGYENFDHPHYTEGKAALLYCGDDKHAKTEVAHLISHIGFEPVDAGPLSSALHMEHITLLWIKMARVEGMGNHAYKLMHKYHK